MDQLSLFCRLKIRTIATCERVMIENITITEEALRIRKVWTNKELDQRQKSCSIFRPPRVTPACGKVKSLRKAESFAASPSLFRDAGKEIEGNIPRLNFHRGYELATQEDSSSSNSTLAFLLLPSLTRTGRDFSFARCAGRWRYMYKNFLLPGKIFINVVIPSGESLVKRDVTAIIVGSFEKWYTSQQKIRCAELFR